MTNEYLESVRKQFESYKKIGEKTFNRLSDEQLLWKYNEESNSIATIVKHLWGNMLSRWTDFLTTDGEKEWRERDAEFENDIKDKKELMFKWNEGWKCLFIALESLNQSNINNTIYIRNKGLTITDAFNRQLAHYAYHIGQIVYVAKMLEGNNWKMLTIPRGESKKYNNKLFSKPKS